MHKFLSFIKSFRLPNKVELGDAFASFSRKQFVLLGLCTIVAFITMVILVERVNTRFMVEIPADGGTITEGVIGVPTLINPVLALSDSDKDVTSLVYSGLMRKVKAGTFIPDLAESYTVSPDGKTYTFILKKNATFHDGTKVTSDDVVFTIDKIKDPLTKSPRKASWDGITVAAPDEQTVIFTLAKPYISFLDNTTTGILPSRLWKSVSIQEFGVSPLNTKAIGTGPYMIDSITRDSEGVPQSYSLKRFKEFVLGTPHIKFINIIPSANEKSVVDELLSNTINQASSISPENAVEIQKEGNSMIHTATLPRVFGIFFNNTKNKIFADPVVTQAFDYALDRQVIVDNVLAGYGTVIHSPIPETLVDDPTALEYQHANSEKANSILDKAGWVMGADGIRAKGGTKTVTQTKKVGKKTVTQQVQVQGGPVTKLAFTLVTGGTPELEKAANLIKTQLQAIGVSVDVQTVSETGQLNTLIRSREYEALFFGQIVNHESDLYSFWHSSQRTDPGLNIALYNNAKIDAILDAAQKTLDPQARINKYKEFITEFNRTLPALFIYSPKYIYVTGDNLNNVSLDTLTIPSDRFVSIYTWFTEKDHVWKIFTK